MLGYELSRRAGKVGTPERPLSDLGLRSYLAFWVSHIIRFFRYCNLRHSYKHKSTDDSASSSRVLSALPPEYPRVRTIGNLPDLTKNPPGDVEENPPKRRKRAKGWDGEAIDPVLNATPLSTFDGKFVYCMPQEYHQLNKYRLCRSHVLDTPCLRNHST